MVLLLTSLELRTSFRREVAAAATVVAATAAAAVAAAVETRVETTAGMGREAQGTATRVGTETFQSGG